MHAYDFRMSIYPVDHSRTDLIEEFNSNVRGPHSFELQCVLNRMRFGSLSGKFVLVTLIPFQLWAIGRLSGVRGRPIELSEDKVFESLEDAEKAIFALRWRELTEKKVHTP